MIKKEICFDFFELKLFFGREESYWENLLKVFEKWSFGLKILLDPKFFMTLGKNFDEKKFQKNFVKTIFSKLFTTEHLNERRKSRNFFLGQTFLIPSHFSKRQNCKVSAHK